MAVDLFATLDIFFGSSESGDFSVLGLYLKELTLPGLTVENALLPLVKICDLAPLIQGISPTNFAFHYSAVSTKSLSSLKSSAPT